MTPWRKLMERPQGLWVRKAFFQVHLWTGIGIGLYVLVVSISGSAIVYRRQISRKYARKTINIAALSRPRVSLPELKLRAQQAYPKYEVYAVYESTRPDRPDEIVLGHSADRIAHFFDPYTGADLGDTESSVMRSLEWMIDLHDNLLAGQTGRIINGIGAFLFILLSITGAFIWWPGIKHWRRAIGINWKTHFARLNWDLHSAIGFWCILFVLVWGISGVYLSFPGVFSERVSNDFLALITRLHFGRFNGFTELLWTVIGLAPAALFITGALMWWNRVLVKKFRQLQ